MAVADTLVSVTRKGIYNNITICWNQISLLMVPFNDFRKHNTARRWDRYLHSAYIAQI